MSALLLEGDKEMITLYGASGFIGTEICRQFPDIYQQGRSEIFPQTNNIIFMASTVDNYNVFADVFIDIETNEILPLKVLEFARAKFGDNFSFTYISSWFVYGNVELPAKEDANCDPTGFYSITRLAGEKLVRSYCETYGIPWKIFRLANIIGIGDKKASLKKNAALYLMSEILQGHEVTIYNEPSYRDFMDVRDCARAIIHLTQYGNTNEVYNIGSGISVNVKELIESVDTLGLIKYKDVPEFHKMVQIQKLSLDVTKLISSGFTSKYSMDDTIQWLKDYYK